MAEAENAAGKASGRRQMSPEELQIIHSTLDWRSPEVTRGAAVDDSADQFRGDLFDRGTSFQKSGPGNTKVPSLRPGELSLMHCNLNGDVDLKTMWADVSKTVVDLQNIDPMEDLWAMMGNVYDHGNYCEFLLGLYEVEKKPVLDFKRMSGDGFVMDGFFRNVKNRLRTKKLIIDEEDLDDGSDVFEDYSDDETEDDGKDGDDDLTSYGYLQLSYDENLVTSWVEKIKTRHVEDKNHIMGLMAYNALHEENLKIIVRKGGKDLRALTQLLLEESNSAALVRNTSALVAAVTSVDDCKEDGYDAAFVYAVFDAMRHWVPGNNRKEQKAITFEITESRETLDNLVQVLYNLDGLKLVSKEDMKAQADKVNEEEKATIVAYLNKQPASPHVDFLTSILNNANAE